MPGAEPPPGTWDAADDVVATLREAGLTVAVAESLTAGLVSARIADVPGASAVLRGGVVAYATDVKAAVLGVDDALLAQHGPVHADVAAQMARGVRSLMGADLGVATTGVAGPDPQAGQPVGTVHLAVAGRGPGRQHWTEVVSDRLAGDRAAVREQAAARALDLLVRTVRAARGAAGRW